MKKLESRLLVGLWNGAAALEKQFGPTSKSEMQLPNDPVIPPLGIHLREMKISTHKTVQT